MTVVLCVFSMSAPAFSQISTGRIFSQRIGNVIDSASREYFGLFPRVASYHTATVETRGDGTIITITRKGDGDTIITLPPRNAAELATLIDNLESVYRGERSVGWPLLTALALPSQPFDEGKEVMVSTLHGEVFAGTVLYAGDSLLYLWPNDSVYDWRRTPEMLIALHARDIDSITTRNAYYEGFGIGILAGGIGSYIINGQPRSTETSLLAPVPLMAFPYLGGLIGGTYFGLRHLVGGSSAAYTTVRSSLSERSYFQRLPPELLRHISTSIPPSADRLMKEIPEIIEEESDPPRLHLLAMLGKREGSVGTFDLNTVGRSSIYEVESGKRLTFFNARYSLLPILSLGVNYLFTNALTNDTTNQEYMNLTAYGVSADLMAVPIDLPVIGRLSIGMGAGVGSARMQGAVSITCPYNDCSTVENYSFDTSMPALFVNVGGTFNITRNFSIHLRTQQFIAGSITIPEIILYSDSPGIGALRVLNEHSINPSFYSLLAGLQVHLF